MNQELLKELYRDLTAEGAERIAQAAEFAYSHLAEIVRRTGENYADHGIEVALVLRECNDDPSLMAVAILHDLLVHPDGEVLLRRAPLDFEETELVRTNYALRRLQIDESKADLNHFMNITGQDSRLLYLRMAHRVNDMRHLQRFDEDLQKTMSKETFDAYSSIAGDVGFHAWSKEMKELSFARLQAGGSSQIEKKISVVLEKNKAAKQSTKKLT